MKIFLYTSVLSDGGAERVLCQLANAFSEEDDVRLIASYKTDNEYFVSSKVQKVYLDESIKNKKSLRQAFRLRRMIKKDKPDVCISFLPQPNFKTLLAAIGLDVKTIISVRNDPNREYAHFATRILAKILYPMADGIVFQTQDAQGFFNKRIQNKSTIIPNPVAPEFIVDKPYAGKRKKKIVSVGRLTAQKNQKLLIDAFAEVHKKFSDYKLAIYGEGELRGELEAHVRELSLEDFVELPGKVSNIKTELYEASCFVLSSDYEGMPNALMEAMALGVPCISTDCPCGGPRSLIKNNKNGILVAAKDKTAMSMAIEKIIRNGNFAKTISDESIKMAFNKGAEVVTSAWKNILGEVVRKK